jgi:predicted O-methyltransferase YrrM
MTHLDLIRETRRRLANETSSQTPSLPKSDCDVLVDLLITEEAKAVIEIGLAYGSWALAIGEALVSSRGERHVIIDPFQDSGFHDAGWETICSAKLDTIATLLRESSQIALPRLAKEGVRADAAFVDGNHLFHNVFVDLYYLQKIVRPGGLIILDNYWWPGVAMAGRYFETNLGWRPHEFPEGTRERLHAMRLPDAPVGTGFQRLTPFWPID